MSGTLVTLRAAGALSALLVLGLLIIRNPVYADIGPDLASAYEQVRNQKLTLDLEISGNLEQAALTATFHFSVSGGRAPVFFSFPGVESPQEFALIELDGRPLAHGQLQIGIHPAYGGRVFVVPWEVIRDSGETHRLTVAGPQRENSQSHYTRWGSWHPYLIDRAQPVPIEAKIRTDADFTVVTSARKVQEIENDGSLLTRWHTVRPQGWLFVSVAEYSQLTTEVNSTPLAIIWPREHTTFDPRDIAKHPGAILSFYTKEFGDSEIETYRFLQIPEKAVHNFSVNGVIATSYGSFEKWKENRLYLEAVLAHEIAHFWWGETVSPNGAGGRWLSEGLAEYARYLFEQDHGMESLPWAYRNMLMLREFADNAPPPLWSKQTDDDDRESIYYQKGSYVLYMLDQRVGHAAFLKILRQFVSTYRGQQASAKDFLDTVEDVTGEDYDWFFSQWLKRPTGPRLGLQDVELSRRNGRFHVTGVVTQNEPPYRLDLPIDVRSAEEREVFHLAVAGTETPFDFALDRKPDRIVLDPEQTIFKWFSKAGIPMDFAEVYGMMGENPRVALEGGDTYFAQTQQLQSSFVDWLRGRFPDLEIVDFDAKAAHSRILFGEAAANYRRSHGLEGLGSSEPDRLSVFVARNPSSSGTFVLGVEGPAPDNWAPILPQGPYRYLEVKNGNYVKVYATGLPDIDASLDELR